MIYDLHALIEANNINGIKAAFADGADIDAKNEYGETPILFALQHSQTREEIIDFLFQYKPNVTLSNDADITPLRYAICDNNLKWISLILEGGADINAQDRLGQTPLLYALLYTRRCNMSKREAIIELLMRYNPDVTLVDKRGTNPLHEAVKNNHLKWVEFFLARGADINALDEQNRTPLLVAIDQPHADDNLSLIHFLLKSGADADAMDGAALRRAVERRYLNIIQLLLDYQANPNILQDKFVGLSVLHTAAQNLDFEVIRLFVKSPLIEVDIKGTFDFDEEWTPLETLIIESQPLLMSEYEFNFSMSSDEYLNFYKISREESDRARKRKFEQAQKNEESYIKCMRALVLKGARQNDAICREHISEKKYNKVLAQIQSILEFIQSAQDRFNFPDIDTTKDVLKLDTWQWQLLWDVCISRKEDSKKEPLFKNLPTELIHNVLYECFDHQLTFKQINAILKDAQFPFEKIQPDSITEQVEQRTTSSVLRCGR